MPDTSIVEQILSALDNGVPAEVSAIARSVGATEAEVTAALAALAQYRKFVHDERRGRVEQSAGETDALPVGTRLGDYVVEGVLGTGAMGVVYRARQVSLDRPVALKVLPKRLVALDARFLARFHREATLAATIRHPHIAEVLGFAEAGDILGFAMRLVEGPTLHDVLQRLARQHLAPVRQTTAAHVRQAVLLVRALADALAVIHARGLVHRDVKPANVLLERDDSDPLAASPVLVDFGLLRPSGGSELTGTHTLLGTPAYASPESTLGQDVDARADVFSLGATLYDLLTVTAPGTRGPATAGLTDARSINPSADARLAAIVAMALQQDKALRYEHGGALRDELDRYLRDEPIRALPAGVWGRLALWVRRDRLRAARAGGAAAASVLLASSVLWAGAWAWSLSCVAATAAAHEREGDLVDAATAYRELLERPRAALLPWLADDMERAGLYWNKDGPLRRALEHVFAGVGTLDGPEGELRAEGELARAGERMCEALYGPEQAAVREAIHAFLLGELREGTPEYRRRIAMDTWTNYLIVQDSPQIVPEALPGLLRRVLFAEKDLVQPATRMAACAAYGAIRSREVFANLVELLLRNDAEELHHLALTASFHVFRWLKKDDSAAFTAISPKLLEQWARGAGRLGGPLSSVTRHLAWWERNPLDRDRSQMLDLPPGIRSAIESERVRIEEEWDKASHDLSQAEQLRVTAGVEASTYERAVWVSRPDQDVERALVRRPREEAQSSRSRVGRLDLLRSAGVPPGSSPPGCAATTARLSGTLFEATYRAGTLRNWEDETRGGYLHFDRPGHSMLRVKSLVPPHARALEVRVEQMISSRPVLRDNGTGVFRIRLVAQRTAADQRALLPWEHSSTVFNTRRGRSDPRIDKATATVPQHVLEDYQEIEVLIEYQHGNTTYRVLGVELAWDVR